MKLSESVAAVWHCLCHRPFCIGRWQFVDLSVLFRLECSHWRDSSCLETYMTWKEFVGCIEALKAEKRNIVS